MSESPISLRDETGVERFRGTQSPGGGSLPVVGRPKNDDGTTYTGLPPGATGPKDWTSYFPGGSGSGFFTYVPGRIGYVPLLISEAIVVTDIEVMVESVSAAGNTNVRVAIVPADTDWQPAAAPTYQGTVVIPNTANEFDVFPLTGLSVPVSPGLYLLACEEDDQVSLNGRPAMFPGGVACDDSTPGLLINGFTAPHVFAPFLGSPPRWDTINVEDAILTKIVEAFIYPFIMKWDPA